jgi:hypothetical protein
MVGLGRVELPTSRLSGVRSNQLSYRPIFSLASSYPRQKDQIRDLKSQKNANFAAKKSHTSLQCGPFSTVDAPEGRVASVAMKTACDLLLLS